MTTRPWLEEGLLDGPEAVLADLQHTDEPVDDAVEFLPRTPQGPTPLKALSSSVRRTLAPAIWCLLAFLLQLMVIMVPFPIHFSSSFLIYFIDAFHLHLPHVGLLFTFIGTLLVSYSCKPSGEASVCTTTSTFQIREFTSAPAITNGVERMSCQISHVII